MRRLNLSWALAALASIPVGCFVDVDGEGEPRPPCTSVEDCPPPPDGCSPYACRDAICVEEALPDGPTTAQVVGDCGVEICAFGKTLFQPDAADAADTNPCTVDSCTDAGPVHAPAADGTPCDLNGLLGSCQMGTCVVACFVPEDCPHEPCQTPVCETNVCGTFPVTGPPTLPVPDPDDCQAPVCAGGVLGQQADDTDLPDDQNPCTADACAAGVPSNTPLPVSQVPGCQGICDGMGACVACLDDAGCMADEHCEAGACYSCQNGIQDPGETGVDCGDPVCLACLGTACTLGNTCASGVCQDLVCCASVCGVCETCAPTGTCGPVADGTLDAGCVAPSACWGGACVAPIPQGAACVAGQAPCEAGLFCVDGFCCDSLCTGLCASCSAAISGGADGSCDEIDDADPQNECTGAMVCCGAGTCGPVGCP